MTNKQKAVIAIVSGSALAGGIGAITKIGLIDTTPWTFVFLRFILASLVLLPYVLFLKKLSLRKFIALIPICLLALASVVFYTFGIKETTATVGQLINSALPLFAVLLAHFFLHDRFSRRKLLGIFIGFFGVCSIIALPFLDKGSAFSGNFYGNLLITVSVVCYTFFLFFSQKAHGKFSPLEITATYVFMSTILSAPFFLYESYLFPNWWKALQPASIASIVYMALTASILTKLLTQYAIKYTNTVTASTAFYLIPVFSFFFANVLLGEQLTLGIFLGALFSIIGVFLVTSAKEP